jgi:hypothetical protein
MRGRCPKMYLSMLRRIALENRQSVGRRRCGYLLESIGGAKVPGGQLPATLARNRKVRGSDVNFS